MLFNEKNHKIGLNIERILLGNYTEFLIGKFKEIENIIIGNETNEKKLKMIKEITTDTQLI